MLGNAMAFLVDAKVYSFFQFWCVLLSLLNQKCLTYVVFGMGDDISLALFLEKLINGTEIKFKRAKSRARLNTRLNCTVPLTTVLAF